MKVFLRNIFAALLSGLLAGQSLSAEGVQQTLIRNVNVFNGLDNKLYENYSVLVEGKLIKQVGAGIEAPAATVVDGGGRTLMPGLIDAHVHLNLMLLNNPRGVVGINDMTWEEVGALAKEASDEFLMSGFTTVRDLCGTGNGLRKRIDSGSIDGPRLYISGACISQSSGHGDWRPDSQVVRATGELSQTERLGIAVLADGEAAVLGAVRNNLAAGADFTKMMAGGGVTSDRDPIHSLQGTMGELKIFVEGNQQFGTYGAVHAYLDESVQRALEAGVMSIEHGNLMSDPKSFQMLANNGAWLVPALGGFADELMDHPYYGNPANPAHEKAKRVNDNRDRWVELAKKYKVQLGFGTDIVVVSREASRNLRDFQITQWGNIFGNFRTLKAMTGDNGRLMALTGENNPYPHKLGVIEGGAYADIILVDGNPLEDLSVIGASPSMFKNEPRPTNAVDSIPFIMKDGKVYRNEL